MRIGPALRRFESKKNKVFLVEDQVSGRLMVLKRYSQPNSPEVALLKCLKGSQVRVPEVICAGNSELVMEYIEGQTLLDVLNHSEREGEEVQTLQGLVLELCAWLKDFYGVVQVNQGLIRGDVNFRNYIHAKGLIYGIDFEDCMPGTIGQDLGRMCAYALTYDPMFTPWKLEFSEMMCAVFGKEFGLARGELLAKVEEGLQEIARRRGIKLPAIMKMWGKA